LIKAAATGIRTGHRDATMILLAYRHGLRVSELANLRWDHIDFRRAKLHLKRAKRGSEFAHPLTARETRALHRLKRESPPSPFLFVTWNGRPITIAAFAKMFSRLGAELGWNWAPHPHMLRHACGYKLANDGVDTRTIQDYLGHRNIRHTVRYAALSEHKFRDLWSD
jgi:type 1 fimbriae regulatory protein FimB/type 1 fimbriae regulatory protein FimE